ncbi:hypothetical protein BD769DRAFT_1384788 [Suillus cothurnatus]|nr:hypothetical protein BD769DRAFT_1384788 [Suillus cothurnatus]
MTLVSNDPSWWPIINVNLIASYFAVAESVGIMYDWELTFGKEVELIWVRYTGIGYAVQSSNNFDNRFSEHSTLMLSIPAKTTELSCRGRYYWARSRKVLIFLVVIFLAITITNVVMISVMMKQITVDWFIVSDVLSGITVCAVVCAGTRLVLGVREYYAELLANSDTATAMTSIAFQEHINVSTGSTMVGTGHSNLGANDALILTGVKVFRNQKNVSLIEAMIGPESILQAYQRLR